MSNSLIFELEGDMFAMIPMPKYLWLYAKPHLSRHHGATGGCLTVDIEKSTNQCNLFFPVGELLDSFPFVASGVSMWDSSLLVNNPNNIYLQPCLVPLNHDCEVLSLSSLMIDNPNGLLASGGYVLPSYRQMLGGEIRLVSIQVDDNLAGGAPETWVWVAGVLVCTRVVATASLAMLVEAGLFDPEIFRITYQVDQMVKDLIGPYQKQFH